MGGSWNIFQSNIIDEPRIRKKSRNFEEGTEEEDAEISKNDIEEKENTKISQKNGIEEKENTTKKSKKLFLKKIQKSHKKWY